LSGDWTHSLDGIHDEVEKHLLKLRRCGQYSWETEHPYGTGE